MILEENIYCVYRHIRPDKNEVFYVGIGDIDRPYEKIGRNRYWKSIVKLNPIYEVEILFENLTWKECCVKEKEFIKLYGRKDLGLGTLCNLTDGGDGATGRVYSEKEIEDKRQRIMGSKNPMFGKKHSEEHKQQISASLKGREIGAYCREKIIESNKNRIIKDSTKEKIRQGNLGKTISQKHIDVMRKDVAQLSLTGDLIEIYPSIREAERKTNVRNADITSVCKKYRGMMKAGGFVWCYMSDLEATVKRLKIDPVKESSNVSVMQLTEAGELIKKWDSMSDVFRELKLHVTSIAAVCRGKANRKSVGGFVWCYTEDYEKTVLKLKANPVRIKDRTPVLQFSTDDVFIKRWDSLRDVTKELHIIADSVAVVCQGKYGRKTAGGFKWKYAA